MSDIETDADTDVDGDDVGFDTDVDGDGVDFETDTDTDADGAGGAPTAVAVLAHIVKSIVDDPAAVTVEEDDSGRRLTLNVRVGEGDLGRVIGRRGRTAASIRSVARAAASKDDVEIDIEFLDD